MYTRESDCALMLINTLCVTSIIIIAVACVSHVVKRACLHIPRRIAVAAAHNDKRAISLLRKLL